MSSPSRFGFSFRGFFDLEPMALAAFWAAIFEIIRYSPSIWARRNAILSFFRRRVDVIALVGTFSGLAALVSSPIIISGVTYGGQTLYGGTSTAITSRINHIIDLSALIMVFYAAIIILVLGTATAEYKRVRRDAAIL